MDSLNNKPQQQQQQQQQNNQSQQKCNQLKRFEILPCSNPDFNLDTCFDNKFVAEDGYLKNTDSYFDSYSHFAIHEEMLKDKVRTESYMNAIVKNKHLFEGKIVLDIGCGTGVLSIFAAQAGAKQVYGIENATIINQARKIIQENKLDQVITLIQGKVEEVQLPVEKVDIIISEWMGYFLLYESMLDTVLFARDKWLAQNGLMFPDRAALFVQSIEDEDYKGQKIHFWEKVYGVNMSCIKKWALMEPLVDVVDKEALNSESCCIFDIDLQTVKKEDLDFASNFKIKIIRDDYVHAIIAYFDVYFSYSHLPIKISTSPESKETHWKQTCFYLEDDLPVRKNDIITGSIAVKKHKENHRELEIKLAINLKQSNNKQYSKTQFYRLT